MIPPGARRSTRCSTGWTPTGNSRSRISGPSASGSCCGTVIAPTRCGRRWTAGGIAIAEAALLAMEHDPGRALPLFRRASVRGPGQPPHGGGRLALIDRPWSRRELLVVLAESRDQEATSECRAALLECHDEAARARRPAVGGGEPSRAYAGPLDHHRRDDVGEPLPVDPLGDGEAARPGDDRPGARPDEAIAARPGALGRLASWFRETFRGSRRPPPSAGRTADGGGRSDGDGDLDRRTRTRRFDKRIRDREASPGTRPRSRHSRQDRHRLEREVVIIRRGPSMFTYALASPRPL